MSELQIALAVIGGIVVAGVLAYNRIQERRYRRQAEATFRSLEQDPLMNAVHEDHPRPPWTPHQRVEPNLSEPHLGDDLSGLDKSTGLYEPHFKEIPQVKEIPNDSIAAASAVPVQESVQPAPRTSRSTPAPPPIKIKPVRENVPLGPVPPFSPHEQAIEYRVHMKGEGILASVFTDVVSQSKALGKQVRWVGFPVRGDAWEELRLWSDIHYREIVVSIQLADRNGSVNEHELVSLCTMVRDAAQQHSLKVTCDDFEAALERARVLDLFCVDVDVLIGLNVVARGDESLPMNHVRREAEIAGMVLAPDGTYQLQDRRGEILFSLCNHESTPFNPQSLDSFTTRGVTLLFDVPRVPDGLKIFDNMVALGRKLAHEVGGLLVDDNLRPLTDTGIERIRQQLAQIYGRMETKGVPAGSDLALRLFS
ncbi:MAG: cell division protein ZipA C-terminal FtsZ-binding domain-containing protein [Thiobacillaceae bacterium]